MGQRYPNFVFTEMGQTQVTKVQLRKRGSLLNVGFNWKPKDKPNILGPVFRVWLCCHLDADLKETKAGLELES